MLLLVVSLGACTNPVDEDYSPAASIDFEPAVLGLGVDRDIQILHPTLDHQVNARAQLLVVMRDPDGNVLPIPPRSFSSSAPAIVEVDAEGLIHPKQPGRATVTARDGRTTGELEVLVVPSYTLVRLGENFPGSVANAINDSGEAVGGVCGDCPSLLWRGEETTEIGLSGVARAINGSGVVIGARQIWEAGVTRDLDIAPQGSFYTAHGINDAGDVVGEHTRTSCAKCPPPTGFLAREGEVIPLDFVAADVNSAGIIVGAWYQNTATPFPVAYTNHERALLSDSWGFAAAVNDEGQVVGTGSSAGGSQAALWDDGEEIILGMLRGYAYASHARAINDSGAIVGRSEFGMVTQREQRFAGFLWRDGTLMNLNHLHTDPDWEVVDARGINESGRIVGIAQHRRDGSTIAIRLDP